MSVPVCCCFFIVWSNKPNNMSWSERYDWGIFCWIKFVNFFRFSIIVIYIATHIHKTESKTKHRLHDKQVNINFSNNISLRSHILSNIMYFFHLIIKKKIVIVRIELLEKSKIYWQRYRPIKLPVSVCCSVFIAGSDKSN